MKLIFTLSVLSFAAAVTSASAANGYYEGRGLLQVDGKDSVPCERVSLDIREDPWGLDIRNFAFECGEDTRGSMDPRHFEVHGGDIYLNGQRVGQRTPGNTSIQIRDPNTGVILGMMFQDQYHDAVDVVQELASPGYNERLSASLRRFDDANPETILKNQIR